MPENEGTEEEAMRLYFEEKLSLRKTCAKVGVSPQTIANWAEARGLSLRSRSEAQLNNSDYPRLWKCKVCKSERYVDSWKEWQVKTCSRKCLNEYKRRNISTRTDRSVRQQIQKLKRAGKTTSEIEAATGLSRSTIYRVLKSS